MHVQVDRPCIGLRLEWYFEDSWKWHAKTYLENVDWRGTRGTIRLIEYRGCSIKRDHGILIGGKKGKLVASDPFNAYEYWVCWSIRKGRKTGQDKFWVCLDHTSEWQDSSRSYFQFVFFTDRSDNITTPRWNNSDRIQQKRTIRTPITRQKNASKHQ